MIPQGSQPKDSLDGTCDDTSCDDTSCDDTSCDDTSCDDTSFDDGNWVSRCEKLTHIVESSAWTIDSETNIKNILTTLAKVLGATNAYVHMISLDGDCFIRICGGLENDLVASDWGSSMPITIGRTAWMFQTHEPIFMDYVHPHEQDQIPRQAVDLGYKVAVSIPLIGSNEVLGMCSLLYKRAIVWTDEDHDYLLMIGRLVGSAILRMRATKKHTELKLLEERQRLSSEIHDNVSHLLGSLSLCAASTLASYDEKNHEAVEAGLEKLESICGETMRVFRDEMLSLRVPLERTEEWSDSVKAILENFERQWGILAELELQVVNKPLSVRMETSFQLTRILNECLSNTLRYADATTVKVLIQEDGYNLVVSISDNGHGFDATSVPPERLGLKIMKERTAATGGKMSIKTGQQGTTVVVRVPRIGTDMQTH